MIKLFHVISDSNIGGAGRYLLTYLRNCDKKTFDIFVAVPKGSKLIDEISKLGFKIYQIENMAEKSVSYDAYRQLYKIFKEIKPDIVHAHASLSARISAKRAGVKTIVYTRHSVFPQKKSLTSGLGKMINGRVGNILSTGIIAVANAAKKNLTDTGIDSDLIRVIYNGVDRVPVAEEKEISEFKEKYKLENVPVIAIIARVEAVKGHIYFVEAAKILKEKGIEAKFIVAGTGAEEEKLKKYTKDNDLSDYVIFTGFLNNVHLLENIMDIQINASYGTEAASLSLLEGMSLGKPAVVSDFGGNPEIIENGINGFVVPKQNSMLLAEKVIELLDNKDLYSRMSKSAVEIYNKKYTSSVMTEKTEGFYKELVGAKK